MVSVEEFLGAVPTDIWVALGVLLVGLVLGFLLSVAVRRLLVSLGVPEQIEGTAFERTARDLGTSTVAIVAKLAMYFVIGLAVIGALTVADLNIAVNFWSEVADFLPQLFLAIFILIIGVVIADKVELVVAERFRGVKLPQTGVIPAAAKYSVLYLAALIALSQIGVATLALVVLLAAYLFALVFLGGLAFRGMLSSGAAGVYLLLNQPYGIGDEVKVGNRRGIVQEVDLFATHVEANDEEYIIPNSKVFEDGIVRIRG
jgi:small-conductance mechanosensitive channel